MPEAGTKHILTKDFATRVKEAIKTVPSRVSVSELRLAILAPVVPERLQPFSEFANSMTQEESRELIRSFNSVARAVAKYRHQMTGKEQDQERVSIHMMQTALDKNVRDVMAISPYTLGFVLTVLDRDSRVKKAHLDHRDGRQRVRNPKILRLSQAGTRN